MPQQPAQLRPAALLLARLTVRISWFLWFIEAVWCREQQQPPAVNEVQLLPVNICSCCTVAIALLLLYAGWRSNCRQASRVRFDRHMCLACATALSAAAAIPVCFGIICSLALDLSPDNTLKEACFDKHFVHGCHCISHSSRTHALIVPACRLALDLSTDKTLKEARFDRHFVRDLVWSRHQLEELAERRFRAAQVCYLVTSGVLQHMMNVVPSVSVLVLGTHQLLRCAQLLSLYI